MGMPITVEIVDGTASQKDVDKVFDYFEYVDKKFSTYKNDSEITKINEGKIGRNEYSQDMATVFTLSEETKQLTDGYFDIQVPGGKYDPSGLVKGWAIHNASKILTEAGFNSFYINAGGDIQAEGLNNQGLPWIIGIRDPFKKEEVMVKVVCISGRGMATSGSYLRGAHIYNPHEAGKPLNEIVSLSVIGPNVYEADRFATAAFAMGCGGINFIENLGGFEGYMINKDGIATMTSNFNKYVKQNA